LKTLLRAYGLRCVTIEEHHDEKAIQDANSAAPAARATTRPCSATCTADRELGLATGQERASRSAAEHEGRPRLSHARPSLAQSRLPGFSHFEICGSNTRRSERDGPSARRSSNGVTEMTLGKRKGGAGDIVPLLKFDARNGIFFRCDRV